MSNLGLFHRLSPPSSHSFTKGRTKPDKARAAASKKSSGSWGRVAVGALQLAVTGISVAAGATQAVAQEQVAQVVDNHEAGQCELIVVDYFEPREDGSTPHGINVRDAARSTGFQGTIREQEVEKSFHSSINDANNQFYWDMGKRDITVEEFGQAFDDNVVAEVETLLGLRESELEEKSILGIRNSTVNYSLGRDPIRTSKKIYEYSSETWTSDDENRVKNGPLRVRNMSRLFGLDADKILSEDENINGPERTRLKQAILDRVHAVITQDERVAQAQESWNDAVREFEANNNSVIISAGNGNGTEKVEWASPEKGGDEVIIPENFDRNYLEVEEVTSVGALHSGQNPGPASYSSKSEGIDIWANGAVKDGDLMKVGTSISAPKMSAVMTEIHCDNPELTSSEVEALVVKALGNELSVTGHEDKTKLDLGLTKAYFAVSPEMAPTLLEALSSRNR